SRGDLFVISENVCIGCLPNIQRYNRVMDKYVETIHPPTTQHLYDFAFGPDNRLYMAANQGIFVYQEAPAGFQLLSSAPLLGSVTGNITFGPDGRLYVRNVANGNVERYTPLGSFVDTLIPAAAMPGSGSIQFGADG